MKHPKKCLYTIPENPLEGKWGKWLRLG
jgi:hypothetical protein